MIDGGGREYTTDEWNDLHSTIGVNSEGAHRRHPYCYIHRIPPMSGNLRTPQSAWTVKVHSGIILTAIYVVYRR